MLLEMFQELQKKFQPFKKLLEVVNKFQPKVFILNMKNFELKLPHLDKKIFSIFLDHTIVDFKI